MAKMKLTQLSTSEFKLDSVGDFCLRPHASNMVLMGSSNEIYILELMYSCDTLVLMPYSIKPLTIPQDKPINHIIRDIDLIKIYETGTVQESQELALDVIYTAECATEQLKARVLQAEIVTKDNRNICCILTTYGYCEIFQKMPITAEWKPLQTNLSNVLFTDVFSSEVLSSNIKTFVAFKTFIDKFIITSFVMSLESSDIIIYLGTASGYIITLKYVESSLKFEEICHLKTSLNRISFIVKYNNLILIGCNLGKVSLVKINFENSSLQEFGYLWSKSDRLTCRKAVLTYDEDLRSYFVIFSKASHILAYRLDLEGTVLSSSTLYISGIKISGIESLSQNEFIITTIMGTVKYLKIVCPNKEELNIEEQVVEHEFDSVNYQILGVAASASKSLWSFVLFRNKDYIHQSKYTSTSAFLTVCKLSNEDSFIKLINMNVKNMNTAQDLVMAINLNIFGNQDHDKYMMYLDLDKLKFPEELNDEFLQKLQIKMIIVRKLAVYQKMKYRKIKTQTRDELEILEPVLQLFHIISRLRYLNKLSTKAIKLTKFQELSIVCMQLKFGFLFNDLIEIKNENREEKNKLQNAVDKISLFIADEFEKCKFNTDNFAKYEECCIMCNHPINDFLKCEQDHEVKRCTISCTQLTLFNTKYCPHCFALVRNNDDVELQELFSSDECIKCIYCRFLFRQDEF